MTKRSKNNKYIRTCAANGAPLTKPQEKAVRSTGWRIGRPWNPIVAKRRTRK